MERGLQAWSLAKEWRGSTIQEIWQVNIVCIFQHMEQMSIFTQGEGVCGEHQRRHRIYQQPCHCCWWCFYVDVIFFVGHILSFIYFHPSFLVPLGVLKRSHQDMFIPSLTKGSKLHNTQKMYRFHKFRKSGGNRKDWVWSCWQSLLEVTTDRISLF